MSQAIRISLLRAGVRNLKEFGYQSVNSENILTDSVFSKFFRSMLEDNLGKSAAHDEEIKKLLSEISHLHDQARDASREGGDIPRLDVHAFALPLSQSSKL